MQAARALVGISARELAASSKVGLATIKRAEAAGVAICGLLRNATSLVRLMEYDLRKTT